MRISDWSSDVCSSDLWRSVGVEPGINGHLIVVMGIIGRRIGSKAAGWPMFEALVDRQDDHLASTTQTAMHQHARKLALHTGIRSEEHTSELQSLMRISYAVFCLKKKNTRQKS